MVSVNAVADADMPSVLDTDPEEYKEMNVDEVLKTTGCGISQVLLVIFCMYFNMSYCYQTLIMYYAADDPPWKCTSRNSSTFCMNNFDKQFETTNKHFKKRCSMNRDEWTYTTNKMFSIVTEYDLVCSKKYLAALANASFFIGWGIGGIFTGVFADKYGRKLALNLCFFMLGTFAIGSCYITAVWQLTLIRAFIGVSTGTCTTVVFIYLSEFSSPNQRSTNLNLVQLSYSASLIILSALAIYVRKWRDLELYATFPGLLAFVLTLFIPESPRWLNETGKVNKAERILRKMLKINKRTTVLFTLKAPTVEKRVQYSYIDLFRKCSIAAFVAAQAIAWFSAGLMYYGLALESSDLGGSIYTDFILSNTADIVGTVIALFIYDYLGRRKSILSSFCGCGVILFCIAAVPLSWVHASLVRIILSLFGKVLATLAFNGIYVWSVELYPTVVRTQGMTICQVASRAGSAIAPFITSVLQSVYEPLPFIVMASVSIFAALCGLILPETNKKPTREKFEDIYRNNREDVAVFDSDVEPLLSD